MSEIDTVQSPYPHEQLTRKSWPPAELEAVSMCPICCSRDRRLLYENLWDNTALVAPGYWSLWRCTSCRCAYLDPRPTSASIGRAYETYYTHTEEPTDIAHEAGGSLGRFRLKLANGYRNWRFGTDMQPCSRLGHVVGRSLPFLRRSSDYQFRYLPRTEAPAPRLLDLGCGDGRWLARVSQSHWEVHGADPDSRAVARAMAKGIDVRQGGAEAWSDAQACFDAITMSHVIEHVHDPREVLTRTLHLLKPGGQLYVETPNIGALGHRWFNRSWRGLEPPRHLVLFNRDTLVELLREVGFRNVKQHRAPSQLDFIIAVSEELRRLEEERISHPATLEPMKRWIRLYSKWTLKRAEFLTITCARRSTQV
jgi:2-polyprenyl-3-methyl-5-hydroxy-6-metoxy-1,4-benzoquinol methylase